MVEMEGKAFLTGVLNKLCKQLASLMAELGKSSGGLKLKMLEEKLKEVSLYLDDAEDWQFFDNNVKEWLDHLMHVVFMADDLVEQINNSKNEKKSFRKAFVGAIKSVYHSLAKSVQGEIDLILTDLDSLLARAIVLELKQVSSSSFPTIVAPLQEEHHVYGRGDEKEEILKILLSEEDEMIVLPIVGKGGIGKTTLAQLVYNDKRVEEHGFSLKAWVTVSTAFDFCTIMKEFLQKVNPRASSSNVNDPNELQRLMKEALRGKRFLFVLDDVWVKKYSSWDPLKSIFTAGDPGSRVIVTTRSIDIGSMVVKMAPTYVLKEVPIEDCWSIFVHHAFNGDRGADPQLEVIGRRIVENCRGLPLAVRCLGSLLCSERSLQKWENILLSHWSKVMENRVLPSLWLSYRSLSSSLKQCFAYCSLFSQDYEFDKKQMVLYWMAEGFIQEGKSMEEVGEEYFDDLVSRSLFQRSSNNFKETYVMHDLVYDLASFVYGNFCLRIGDDLNNVTIRTRHLIYNKHVSFDDLLTSLSTAKHLRTLLDIQELYRSVPGEDFVEAFVPKARCLRVLSISLASSVFHHSLGDLKMLRYLNLSESKIKELPDSIYSLIHLQTLILRYCYSLTQLPTDLPRKLSKLRYLDTRYTTTLTKMPPKMGSLKELRILTEFVLGQGDGSGCSTLKELGELHHLGRLGISKLQNVESLEDVQKANLRDKAEMKELFLWWHYDPRNMVEVVNVFDALQPHQNLEKLEVWFYPGSSFPKWVGDASFSKIVRVEFYGGESSVLPPLGQLPSLRELSIQRYDMVEKIGKELLYGNDSNSSITPFPSLETLSFRCMRRWKEWSFVGNESACFPRLKTLELINCPELECINKEDEDERAEMKSTKLHHHCPSLSKLWIDECPLLERRYQIYKGKHWQYLSHIPQTSIYGPTTDELEREDEERRRGEEKSVSHISEMHKTGSTTIVELSDELEWEEEKMRQDEKKSETHKTGSTVDDNETEDRSALTAVFVKLFEQLASPELRTNSVSSKLEKLEENLKKVRVYLDDAEDRKLSNKNVEEWLDELKHVIFVAADLVEQINNSKKEKNPKSKDDDSVEFFKSVYHSLAKTGQGGIDLILTDLEGLYDRARDLELKHTSTNTVQKMPFKHEDVQKANLGGKLRISKLQNVENLEDVQNANLRDELEMKELFLEWEDSETSNMILAVDVLDALQPHKKLEKLSVYGYPGSSFPNWVGERSFSELTSVELEGDRSCFLPPLGQLPSLRKLKIQNFDEVEKIGDEFLYGNDTNSSITPFPCLETLSFLNMRRWKEWSFVGNESGCFRCLGSLTISFCPKLESIISIGPEMESAKLTQLWPSLYQLTIFECPKLEKRYQKYKGEHWHYISNISKIRIKGSVTTGMYNISIW